MVSVGKRDSHTLFFVQRAEQAMSKAAEEVNRARADQKQHQDLLLVDEKMEGFPGGSLLTPGMLVQVLLSLCSHSKSQVAHYCVLAR